MNRKRILLLLGILTYIVFWGCMCKSCIDSFTNPDIETLEDACALLKEATGYELFSEDAELIINTHKGLASVSFVRDRQKNIDSKCSELAQSDLKWKKIQIHQQDISCFLTDTVKAIAEFEVIFDINNGYYDWAYIDAGVGRDICVCLVDVETGNIALYMWYD